MRKNPASEGQHLDVYSTLDRMYNELLRPKVTNKRYQINKKANEYVADQALCVFTVAPSGRYGVNGELNFVSLVYQYLYLDYSSVNDNRWSIRVTTH